MASLSLRHIYKIYQGNVKAVSDFNLEIDDKEFIVFVGPSGCGKSTTLRMVAGLEEISAGELYIDGRLVNDVEPKDRDIAMVFQNYALYPHMTVYDNMAFGLRLRKMPSKEIDTRVQEAAAILGITPLLTRKPKALSGGQRQRVALGRAIVREPKVFLLDEPLSNLDAKLRVQMRTEITKLHNRLATTFIYVTHDQTEAMTMGTRIVVMKDGIVQQVDTPQNLYDNPVNLFVASFIGTPQMNFFTAILTEENGDMFANFGENKIKVPKSKAKRLIDKSYMGKEIVLGVRPEDIHDEEIFISSSPDTIINSHVDVIEKLGNETILYMEVDGKEDYTVARIDARTTVVGGDNVKLAIDAQHIHFFDKETELSIMGVPKVNTVSAKLIAEEKGLTVRFGVNKFDLPVSVSERLTNFDSINGDVVLGLKPDCLKTEGDEGDFKFEGKVNFIEKYPRYTAIYNVVSGKDTFIVSKEPVETNVSEGDKMTYYISPADIVLYDKTMEKILAEKPVSKNIASATVSIKENVATAKFGKNSLSFPTDNNFNTSGTFQIAINPNAVEVGKEALAKAPKMVLSGSILDAEVLGEKTVVYAKVDGIDDYFTAFLSEANYAVGDKVKFAVVPSGVSATLPKSLDAVIAEKFADAPEYTFVEKVEEKPAPVVEEAPVVEAPVVEETAITQVEAPAKVEKKPVAKKPAATTAKKPAAKKPATTAKKPAATAKKPVEKK